MTSQWQEDYPDGAPERPSAVSGRDWQMFLEHVSMLLPYRLIGERHGVTAETVRRRCYRVDSAIRLRDKRLRI